MPLSGQFVAIWAIEAAIFSATLQWSDGQLLAYDPFSDEWLLEDDSGYDRHFFAVQKSIYVII